MNSTPNMPESIDFGSFRILPYRRELLSNGEPLKIGGRAFELLMVLIERPGAVVGKDELMARVWPGRVVGETNLQTQILALRDVLEPERDLIRTVCGRGYQFTGHIDSAWVASNCHAPQSVSMAIDAVPPPTNLPQPVSELIGRGDEIAALLDLVRAGRLVTLTGPGGIGKTRLALTVARELLRQFPEGVWLVELSPLADPDLVPATVAAAIGLELGADEISAQRVAQVLGGRRLLVILDTCEHVLDAAAAMAEALLRTSAQGAVIATSREPLRTEGERLYPVPPLAVPDESAQDPRDYDAVRLFVDRVRAAEPCPGHYSATTIAAICRRLDGIPLAIEMAAARVTALGVEELAARLDDRFRLLTKGRRTALPRHQTLRATLDWSYDLLTETEQALLRRLAAFAGAFTLDAAAAVANVEAGSIDILDHLSSLIAKSLVAAEVGDSLPRYALLDTTRAYALEKLDESGERARLSCRHVAYYRTLFEQAENELETRAAPDWLAEYGWQIGNLRAALDWAFSRGGDAERGIALTAAAVPLWLHLSLLEECRSRVERALAVLDVAEVEAADLCEMKLQAALGVAFIYSSDVTFAAMNAAWARALEIAERLGNMEFQMRSLWGLWFANWVSGRHRVALTLAERFRALAASGGSMNDMMVGERLIGVSQQFLGDQSGARVHLERMLRHYDPPSPASHVLRFQSDQRVAASIYLARVLWLQGYPDQAVRKARQALEDAGANDHMVSSCYVLIHGACSIALWTGDLHTAECYAEMLIDLSKRCSLARWLAFGRSYQGVVAIRRGDITTGLPLLRSALDDLGEINSPLRCFMFPGEIAEALGRIGQTDDGLATLDAAIAHVERTEELWGMAELLRIKGDLLLRQAAPNAATKAEQYFRDALGLARRQDARSWELRAATSLARLLRDRDQRATGVASLRPVYDRFTEGFGTADLKAAAALLHELG
jgi:predicted ATPase/DNA-binding winged helix-turn-helix (wHTH) protein